MPIGLGVTSDYKQNSLELVASLLKIKDLNHLSFNFDLGSFNSKKMLDLDKLGEISRYLTEIYDLVLPYHVPIN